jgi:hypothetical protein
LKGPDAASRSNREQAAFTTETGRQEDHEGAWLQCFVVFPSSWSFRLRGYSFLFVMILDEKIGIEIKSNTLTQLQEGPCWCTAPDHPGASWLLSQISSSIHAI